MDREIVFLHELDFPQIKSANNYSRVNKENFDYAYYKLFTTIFLDKKDVVVTMNQITDSEFFIEWYTDNKDVLLELLRQGRIKISPYSNVTSTLVYIRNSFEREFIYSASIEKIKNHHSNDKSKPNDKYYIELKEIMKVAISSSNFYQVKDKLKNTCKKYLNDKDENEIKFDVEIIENYVHYIFDITAAALNHYMLPKDNKKGNGISLVTCIQLALKANNISDETKKLLQRSIYLTSSQFEEIQNILNKIEKENNINNNLRQQIESEIYNATHVTCYDSFSCLEDLIEGPNTKNNIIPYLEKISNEIKNNRSFWHNQYKDTEYLELKLVIDTCYNMTLENSIDGLDLLSKKTEKEKIAYFEKRFEYYNSIHNCKKNTIFEFCRNSKLWKLAISSFDVGSKDSLVEQIKAKKMGYGTVVFLAVLFLAVPFGIKSLICAIISKQEMISSIISTDNTNVIRSFIFKHIESIIHLISIILTAILSPFLINIISKLKKIPKIQSHFSQIIEKCKVVRKNNKILKEIKEISNFHNKNT